MADLSRDEALLAAFESGHDFHAATASRVFGVDPSRWTRSSGYLPDLTADNRQRREMAERMALNAPIQGSAADVIKVAMLRVRAALAVAGLRLRMLLQVHDELIFEVAPGELSALEKLVKTEMGPAPELRVPLEVCTGGRKRATDPEAVAPRQATSTEAVRPRRANSLMTRNCWYLV
jgi:DNA polymerase I-like protein with 3'-5' exonuclease and polymerase domains